MKYFTGLSGMGGLAVMLIVAASAPAEDTPGGVVVVSSRLIDYLVARPIEERTRIRHDVLGTYTEGTVVTRGTLETRLVPDAQRGHLELLIRANAALDGGRGYSGPVTIFSSSRTQIEGRKSIALTSSGLKWQPSVVHCLTQINIQDIQARLRLVERIAWRRAARMQARVEQAVSRDAEAKIRTSMDRIADRGLESGNGAIRQRIGPTADSLRLAERVRIDTSTMRLRGVMFPASGNAIGKEAPAIDPHHDGTVLLHEALVGDVCQTLLAGVTVQDRELMDFMKLLVGSAPPPLWVHTRAPRWSVTFSREEPFQVRFRDDSARFCLQIASVRIDDQEFNDPISIEAEYKLHISADGPVLVREGNVLISGRSGMSRSQSTAEQWLERRFRGVFQPEIRLLGLIPPAGSNWEPLRGLDLRRLTADDGWLAVGYQIAPHAKRAPLSISLAEE